MPPGDSKNEKQSISLRVPKSELNDWDEAVEDGEYKDRTKLIRRATNLEINNGFDKQSELESVDVDLTSVENRLQSLENQHQQIQEVISRIQTNVAYLVDLEGETVNITSEVYESLPQFETTREAEIAINDSVYDLETPAAGRAEKYGWVKDIQAKFLGYSDHDVINTLNTLVSDVPSVQQYTKDNKRFIYEVEE